MRLIRSLTNWPEAARGSVMALGNFDGLHKGHLAVLGAAREASRAENRPLAVMTFEPHPRRFFKPDLPILRIVPFAEKARLLREAGVEYLYVAHFNRAFSEITAERFVREILLENLGVGHVVTGYNFAFGNRRAGDADYLHDMAAELGFRYTRVPAYASEAAPEGYSSTAIRHALATGKVEQASAMLGRPYAISGIVIHGDQRGRTIGFPTANIRPSPLFLPAFGVYAVRMQLANGESYEGVANLGTRPTVDGTGPRLETFAFGLNHEIYGEHARIQLCHFLRGEQKFSGIDALKAQIAVDVDAAKGYFARTSQGSAA